MANSSIPGHLPTLEKLLRQPGRVMLPQPAFDPQFKTIANVQHDDIDQMRPFLGGMAMQPHKVVIQRPVTPPPSCPG